MSKAEVFINFVSGRLSEPSTWQGIGFVVGLTGSKVGMDMDWGQAAGLGGIISAALKMLLPDSK